PVREAHGCGRCVVGGSLRSLLGTEHVLSESVLRNPPVSVVFLAVPVANRSDLTCSKEAIDRIQRVVSQIRPNVLRRQYIRQLVSCRRSQAVQPSSVSPTTR